ncbi:MAG: saccharopine dehydrogenase NADP-binding domain-containing protein, partial [Gemmatimonadetes bacterium]|nr:saccharopine dehydrogenase NADP-binding domain-containing protein [Gemmatimonadota bacterium]
MRSTASRSARALTKAPRQTPRPAKPLGPTDRTPDDEAHVVILYGATGYTGRLVLDECLTLGLRPVLAGRDATALESLAAEHQCEMRIASLDDRPALDALLRGATAVIHCAGPFSHTSRPMADACIRNGVHYLDITGEIAVFESLAARDAEAAAA